MCVEPFGFKADLFSKRLNSAWNWVGMAVQVPEGSEGQALPHPPGVERKNIPQAQGEFPACAILLGFLQTEQELL